MLCRLQVAATCANCVAVTGACKPVETTRAEHRPACGCVFNIHSWCCTLLRSRQWHSTAVSTQQLVQSWHCSGTMGKGTCCSDCTAFYSQCVADFLAVGLSRLWEARSACLQAAGRATDRCSQRREHSSQTPRPILIVMYRHNLLHLSRDEALVNSQELLRRGSATGCNRDDNSTAGLQSSEHMPTQFASLLCER